MAHQFRVTRNLAALRRVTAGYREAGETIALVPTMGALHAGHQSLVELAKRKAHRVVVSIFVNPTQFGPKEDFATYPRSWDTDVAALKSAKIDLIWAPQLRIMYPPGFATRIVPEGPAVAGLEDAFRPHFFGGVATVVAKLFIQAQPDIAIFGQKDYQQLKVIERMVADMALPVRIVAAPTMREKDGLAMSSRNAYLSAQDRAAAPVLYRVLRGVATGLRRGEPLERNLAKARTEIDRAGFTLDYLEARDAETLQPLGARPKGRIRLLVAARIGKTRLIDNIAV